MKKESQEIVEFSKVGTFRASLHIVCALNGCKGYKVQPLRTNHVVAAGAIPSAIHGYNCKYLVPGPGASRFW